MNLVIVYLFFDLRCGSDIYDPGRGFFHHADLHVHITPDIKNPAY